MTVTYYQGTCYYKPNRRLTTVTPFQGFVGPWNQTRRPPMI